LIADDDKKSSRAIERQDTSGFAGINTLSLVEDGPERELAIAFINWMLDTAV
jgi:hypothetical protein